MSDTRLAYDDASTTTEMATDCRAVELALHLPRQVSRAAKGALDAIPDGLLPQAPKPVQRVSFAVSDAAARFASKFLD